MDLKDDNYSQLLKSLKYCIKTLSDSQIEVYFIQATNCTVLFQNDDTGLYGHLTGVPKALLPGVGGKKILDFWWETVNT